MEYSSRVSNVQTTYIGLKAFNKFNDVLSGHQVYTFFSFCISTISKSINHLDKEYKHKYLWIKLSGEENEGRAHFKSMAIFCIGIQFWIL